MESEKKSSNPGSAITLGGRCIGDCQNRRQISEQLALILQIVNRPLDINDCVTSTGTCRRKGIMESDAPAKAEIDMIEEINELRETTKETLRTVRRAAANRIGEGFLKDFARIMGKASELPPGPRAKTQNEIGALVKEMDRMLDDYDYVSISPSEGEIFDSRIHTPIKITGNKGENTLSVVDKLFRPGIRTRGGKVVLHARVGLRLETKSRDQGESK